MTPHLFLLIAASLPGDFWRTLSFAPCGDCDGDGVSEIAIGLPRDDAHGEDSGRVLILSGRNGNVVRELHTDVLRSGFGFALATGCDADKDGRVDLIVAAHRDGRAGSEVRSGRVHAISLSTGRPIHEWGPPDEVKAGIGFASEVEVVADVDGDGVRDILSINRLEDDRELGFLFPATVQSATSGKWMRSFPIQVETRALCALDLDGDHGRDFVVGSQDRIQWASPTTSGTHDFPTDSFRGLQVERIADVGDLDRDGRADLAVIGPTGSGSLVQTVVVYSLAREARLFEVRGEALRKAARSEALASANRLYVCGAPDLDGDNRGELFVVLPGADPRGLGCGFAALVSSRDGSFLWTATGTEDVRLGVAWFDSDFTQVRRMPDLDRDGLDDLAVGADGASRSEPFEQNGAQLSVLSSKTGARIATFDFRSGTPPIVHFTRSTAPESKAK